MNPIRAAIERPIAVVAVVMTSLTAVYQTALYHYVTTNEIPDGFSNAGLSGEPVAHFLGEHLCAG